MLVWQAHKNFVRQIVFLGDGRTVATTAGKSRFVWVWDATGRTLARKLNSHALPEPASRWEPSERSVEAVASTPDGSGLATLTTTGVVKVWDAATGEARCGWRGVGWSGRALALAPDARSVVTLYGSQTVRWKLADPPPAPGAAYPHHTLVGVPCEAVAFSRDGSWLAGHRPDGVNLWSVPSYRRTFEKAPPAATVGLLTFAPDGTRVAAVRGPEVHTWVRSRDRWAAGPVVRGNGAQVADAAFSPDGRTLLSVGRDGTIRMSDVETGEPRQTFDFGIGEVRAAAFSPDGLTAAAGGAKGQIVVWDVDG